MKAWKYCIKISIKLKGINPRNVSSGNYLIQKSLNSLILHDLKKIVGVIPEIEVIHKHGRRAGRGVYIFFSSPDLYYERLRDLWEGRWSEDIDIGWPKRKFSFTEYRVWFFRFPSRDRYFYNVPSCVVYRSSADSRVSIRLKEDSITQMIGKINGNQDRNYITAKQIYWLEENIASDLVFLKLRRMKVEKKDWKIKKID